MSDKPTSIVVMARKSLTHASPRTKLLVGVLGAIQLGLLGAAHRDISRRDPGELNGSKRKWRAITLINFVGPIWYFARGRKQAD